MSNTRTTTTRTRATSTRARQSKPPTPKIRFMGKEYKVASKVGIWPLMQFARVAETGISATDPRGLAAAHAFLQDVIDPDDWGRFQEDMIMNKVTDLDELLTAAGEAIQAVGEKISASKNGKAAKAEVVREEIQD